MDEEESEGEDDEDENHEDSEEDGDDKIEREEEEKQTPEESRAKHQHKFIHSRTAQLVEKEVEGKKRKHSSGDKVGAKIPFRITKEEIREVIESSLVGAFALSMGSSTSSCNLR